MIEMLDFSMKISIAKWIGATMSLRLKKRLDLFAGMAASGSSFGRAPRMIIRSDFIQILSFPD